VTKLGKLQRRISRAFIAEPGRKTTAELIEWCYPRTGAMKHCRRFAVRRAAARIADRVGRTNPGGFIWELKPSHLLPSGKSQRD
jgi:hypothetical protein